MKLIDYFAPLNLKTISEYLLILLFLDILGTFVKNIFFKGFKNQKSRVINWLIGLGFFVSIWFLVSLFVPYTLLNLAISILTLSCISIPSYIRNKEYELLFSEIKSLMLPILVILPFLPAVFVKASLPPYYSDEMAYHFISPFTAMHLSPIKYVGGIYSDLPRLMNMFYEIIFSLTKTYSVARLFHFTVLVTSMFYSYKILKLNFNWFYGFLYVFIFFSLPQDIVLTSTLGYIDVAAYSFISMALVSFIWFVKTGSGEAIAMMFISWSLNLATKYTGVSTFAIFILTLLATMYLIRDKISKVLNFKLFASVTVAFLIFGGYWYLKNLVLFGNPIFPFIFKCWGIHVEVCPQAGGFFGDWTTKINISNLPLILRQLFIRNTMLQIAVVLSPLFALFIKNKEDKIISFALIFGVLSELLLLKFFSGFYIRYQQHLQLYLLIVVIVVYLSQMRFKIVNFFSRTILILVILMSIGLYGYTVKYSNSLKFLNWNEINYSIGKMDIYGWIDFHFPRMKNTIRWCENKENEEVKKLARYDPDLIWFDYDGLKRVFLLNCEYINPPLNTSNIDKMIDYAVSDKLEFYIASKSRCIKDNEIVKLHPNERDDMLELRKINNKIICNSKEFEPYLYKFDYRHFQ